MTTPATGPAAPTAASSDMDRLLVRGIAWTGAAKYASQILRWASTLVVVRMLTPGDYGIYGMAQVFLGLVLLLTEFGVGTAVITLRELDDEEIAQLNGVAILFGLAAGLLTCGAAVPMARFYNAPELTLVMLVMSVGFFIRSFRAVPIALLQRELRFKLFALFETIDAVILSVLMVLFALGGFRYWTLVLGDLVSGLLGTLLLLSQRRHRLACPRFARVKQALVFSWHVVVARVAWYWYSNADFVVAGRFLGKASLGVYTLAFELSRLPVEKITALVGRVTPAFFSAAQDDNDTLRRYLVSITEGLAVVTVPLCCGLALVASTFVPVVLGERWLGAIVPLTALGGYAAWLSVSALFPHILVVKREVRLVARVNLVIAVVLPVAFLVGQQLWGTAGLAFAWITVHPLLSLPIYARVFRSIELPFRRYVNALLPSVSAALAMVGAVLLVRSRFPGPPSALRLGIETGVGALTYVLVLLVFFRDRIARFRETIRTLRKG